MANYKILAPKLISSENFFREAAKVVAHAKMHISLICLTIYRDQVTSSLIDELLAAARRGVDVNIAADFSTLFHVASGRKSASTTPHSPAMKSIRTLEKEFKSAGAKFHLLGQKSLTFVGVTHSKWLVVDDLVFAFGGINLEPAAAKNTDFMLLFRDENLAKIFTTKQREIEHADRTGRLTHNTSVATDVGTILFDGNVVSRSLILSRAIELAKQADQILLVSQYCPSGQLGRILKQKRAQVYFNSSGNANTWFNRWFLRASAKINRPLNLYTRPRYLHAKFMIFTFPNGQKVALTGSHNFSALLARLGYREVALETRDSRIIDQLEKFFAKKIK